MTELDKVAKAIRDLHGAEGTHVRSEPIHETFRGETVWDGIVEVFAIRGHPKARTAYAWSHETDAGGRRDVGVLQLPLVMSPLDAVQASIAAQVRDNR